MKKLLIIPIILGVALYSFYHHNIEGEKLYAQPNQLREMENTILTTENEEIFSSKKESNITEPKLFKIEMASDMNISRDNEIEIQASVKNASNPDECNFWWYEENELIGMGVPLKMSFDKGEHLITLKAKTAEGNESSQEILVTAWDYRKVIRMYYNNISEMFETQRFTVYDHKDRLVLRESPYSKYMVTFNENGQEEEERNEYLFHPEWSEIKRYTYTDDGQIETIKSLNLNEEIMQVEKNIFDAEGNITNTLVGINEDELIDYSKLYRYESTIYEHDSSYYESDYGYENDKEVKNEHNKTIYEEHNYGYVKEIIKYEYDDNQSLTKSEKTSFYRNGKNDIGINFYDEDGNTLKSEKIYKNEDEVLCHYSSISTYNDKHQTLSTTDKVLDGDCQDVYVFNSYEEYSYDKNDELKAVERGEEKGSEEKYTSYKVIKLYSNTLEGDEQ